MTDIQPRFEDLRPGQHVTVGFPDNVTERARFVSIDGNVVTLFSLQGSTGYHYEIHSEVGKWYLANPGDHIQVRLIEAPITTRRILVPDDESVEATMYHLSPVNDAHQERYVIRPNRVVMRTVHPEHGRPNLRAQAVLERFGWDADAPLGPVTFEARRYDTGVIFGVVGGIAPVDLPDPDEGL